MVLYQYVEKIESREDFVAFVEHLRADYVEHGDTWENDDITGFLESLAAWTKDVPGYLEREGIDIESPPTWRLVGMMLLAARSYE